MKTSSLILAASALAMVGCGSSNPLRETALGLSAAASIGRSVQLALDAVPGTEVSSCVQVTQGCNNNYPCDATATVNLGADWELMGAELRLLLLSDTRKHECNAQCQSGRDKRR